MVQLMLLNDPEAPVEEPQHSHHHLNQLDFPLVQLKLLNDPEVPVEELQHRHHHLNPLVQLNNMMALDPLVECFVLNLLQLQPIQ